MAGVNYLKNFINNFHSGLNFIYTENQALF